MSRHPTPVHGPRRGRRRRGQRRREQGRRLRGGREQGSSAVEVVLLAPVLMLLVFVIVQTALYIHARHVALAAAQQGARTASAGSPDGTRTPATSAQVQATTIDYIHQLGADLVSAPTVTVNRSTTQATVRVTAHAISILPGFTLHVSETSTSALETYRAP